MWWVNDTPWSGCLSSPARVVSCQRSGSPPETFGWTGLKPRSFPFWQICGFHWRISLSSLSASGGGLEARTEVWAPAHEFLVTKLLMYLHTTYLWKATEEGSQPGAALLVRVRLGNLGFVSSGGRMETSFTMSIPCSLTVKKDPLPCSCWGQRLCGNTAGHHYLRCFSHPGNKVDATRHDF